MRYLILLLCVLLAGCSITIKEWGPIKDIKINILGELDEERAEHDASSFEAQVNKQFDSNIKLPRLPFRAGRYGQSLIEGDKAKAITIEGKF